MIRFSTLGLHQITQSQMLETQRRLFETQVQVASGKVSRDYGGIAIESRRLINLETAVSEAEGFIKNIDVTDSRLKLMESSIAGAFDVAARFRDLLVNALNIDNASLLTLNQRAEDMIKDLASALNTKQDARFLFAGSRIDTTPIDLSILLAPNVPLVDAAEFKGGATTAGTGITGLTGISKVQVESGNTGDAFQLVYDNSTQVFTITNLAGGASGSITLQGAPLAGQTKTLTFTVGGEKVVLTIDENFNPATAITTATITGNVAGGAGAFGAVTVKNTSGDISKIDFNTIETSGTAASATLTLSSTDGNFVATGVNLSNNASLVSVTLVNATTGATFQIAINVTTGLDDAAIADNSTEIRLGDFLRNVAATNGALNLTEARPGDPGYDANNPSFYKGDSTKLTVRVDENATVEYGVTAGESGFEKLFRALVTVRNATLTPGNVDRTALDAALGLAIQAMDEIPDLRSQVGSDLLTLDVMKSRHEDFVLFTTEAVSQIENVDVTAAIARFSTDQVQLEASYMLTARLSRLSLTNFLR